MPNNQPLPRPNLPGVSDDQNSDSQNQAAQDQTVQDQQGEQSGSPQQPQQPPQQSQQPQQAAPPKAAGDKVASAKQAPAGLDRFAPGGAPPTGMTPNSASRDQDPTPKIEQDQQVEGSQTGSDAAATQSSNQADSQQSSQSSSAATPPKLPQAGGKTISQSTVGAGSASSQKNLQLGGQPQAPNQEAPNQAPGLAQRSTHPGSVKPTGRGNLSPATGANTMQAAGAPANPATQAGNQPNLGKSSAPPIQKPSQNKKQPVFAKAKKSPLKFVPFVLGGLVVIGVVGFLISRVLSGGSSGGAGTDGPAQTESGSAANNQAATQTTGQKATLTYWGLWEPNSVLQEVIADFEQDNPNIQVDYRKQSHKDYRERLQSAISSGNGPDLFRYHATWVPMLADDLAPMPSSVMSPAQFKQAYYPVMQRQLQLDGQFVGLPLMYDGLALFYNKKILQTLNEQPPTTWSELRLLAGKLTVRSGGKVERGGLAIGNTSNVEHFSDILGLLILQNGGDPSKPVTSEVRDAIKFYTSFAQNNPVYSPQLPPSSVAFSREEVAMIFAPSWRVFEIQNRNPDLEIGIVPVPKLSDQGTAWASYWAEGVSAKSENQDEAWQLLKYLSSESVLKKLHAAQSQIRAFGELYPRTDMASQLGGQLTAPFLEDAPAAKSWFLCSYTHDNGLNDQMIQYYQQAVDSYAEGENIETVLDTLKLGVTQVLRQYNAN